MKSVVAFSGPLQAAVHLGSQLHYAYRSLLAGSSRVTPTNGGQALVDNLIALGASKAFGVPGESYLAVLDALHDTQGRLDMIGCRNEGGAAFMACAYGQLTGLPGLCFVTRGPGATNASIGVHSAMQNSSPMILFVGQVGTGLLEREAFQEIDYRSYFGSVAKWVTQIDDAARIPELLARAWTTALSGRPGPVVVALPEDMLSAHCDTPALKAPVVISEPAPTEADVHKAMQLLSGAQRPLILVGGTRWSTAGKSDLQQFAQRCDIPVLAAFRFQDVYDNHLETYAGDAGVGMAAHTKTLIQQADVILAINVRFGEMTTDAYTLLQVPKPSQTLIHTHSSDAELGKVYVADLTIHAGPNTLCQALALQTIQGPWADWRANARAGYESGFTVKPQPGDVDMAAITEWLRERLPDDVILTNGAGNFAVWPNRFFRFGQHQRLLAPQSGAMGFGVPAAIAAKLVCPERVVVCFAGDGDFQMNCQELGTALQAKAHPIILIINNGLYGTIRMHQERNFPARISATTLENPDFVMLAKSYGFNAETVKTTAEFAPAFERAMLLAQPLAQAQTHDGMQGTLPAQTKGTVLDIHISAEALTPYQTLSQIRNTQQP